MVKWALLVGGPLLLVTHGAWPWALLWLVLDAALYAWSMRRMPWVACRWCQGSGQSTHGGLLAVLFPSVFGRCLLCRGAKGWVRLGIRVLDKARAEREKLGDRG